MAAMAEASFTLAVPTPPAIPEEGGPRRIGSALTLEDGAPDLAALEGKDHCAEGLARLLFQYRGKPRLEALLCAFLDQVQELEGALQDLFLLRTLEDAEGAQLDGLGAIVGEPRKDRPDDVFRVYLRIRILVNRSDGQPADLYAILLQGFPGAEAVLLEHFPAAIQLLLLDDIGDVDPGDFVLYLRQAKAAGVRLEFVYTYAPQADTFIWNGTPEQGWGSTNDAGLGGAWAGVR